MLTTTPRMHRNVVRGRIRPPFPVFPPRLAWPVRGGASRLVPVFPEAGSYSNPEVAGERRGGGTAELTERITACRKLKVSNR